MFFNPLDEFFKSTCGAISADKAITFRVKGDFNSVVFILKSDKDGAENCYLMENKGDFFKLTLTLSVGLYFYTFSVGDGKFIGKNFDFTGFITTNPEYYQLTVYDKDYRTPDWFKGGVIYQIFPDRFNRKNEHKILSNGQYLHAEWEETPVFLPNENGKVLNNDFFGGDLLGIVDKLDYLKSLGVTVIYLNPIFKAYSNHRYDTGDYMSIDQILGDINDFKLLIDSADRLGIKVVLDGVFNHTGDDSVYFNKYGNYNSIGAYQSKDSPYYSWYNFTEYPTKYDAWWGISVLPAVNESNEQFIDFITGKNGVLEHYTKLGIGGWRLDVVDELPSNFVKKIRNAVKGVDNDAIIIGEIWEDASNKISYGVRREYFQGKELDSVMNYPLKDAIINFVKTGEEKSLINVIRTQLDHYPEDVLHSLMNILATHDTVRLLTAVGGVDMTSKSKAEMSQTFIDECEIDDAILKLKTAVLLQFTLYGVPSIYYGDEVGMQGYVDPLNRKCFPWGKENTEILEWYKLLSKIRSEYDAFSSGSFNEIYACNGAIIYERIGENSQVLVAVNLSERSLRLDFDGEIKNLLNGSVFDDKLELKPKEFGIFIKND